MENQNRIESLELVVSTQTGKDNPSVENCKLTTETEFTTKEIMMVYDCYLQAVNEIKTEYRMRNSISFLDFVVRFEDGNSEELCLSSYTNGDMYYQLTMNEIKKQMNDHIEFCKI